MSILDKIFGTSATPVVEPVVPAATTVGPNTITGIDDQGKPTQVTPVTDANGLIPGQPVPGEEKKDDSPLDPFKDLWETKPVDKDNPPAEEIPLALNTEDITKALTKADFSSVITPENLTLILAGGEEAKEAFITTINEIGKQSLLQSTLVGNKLTEQMIERALERQAAQLPAQIRSQTTSSHLIDTHPIFSNPAIKPVIEATTQQLLDKFPKDTPAEITEKVNNYILAMAAEFAPKPASPGGVENVNETDWSKFLTG